MAGLFASNHLSAFHEVRRGHHQALQYRTFSNAKKCDYFSWIFHERSARHQVLPSTIFTQHSIEWWAGGPPPCLAFVIFGDISFCIGLLRHFSRSVRAPGSLALQISKIQILASNNSPKGTDSKFCFSICLDGPHTRSLGGGSSHESTKSPKSGIPDLGTPKPSRIRISALRTSWKVILCAFES